MHCEANRCNSGRKPCTRAVCGYAPDSDEAADKPLTTPEQAMSTVPLAFAAIVTLAVLAALLIANPHLWSYWPWLVKLVSFDWR